MTIEELLDTWQKDCPSRETLTTDIAEQLSLIPHLHGKYYRFYLHAKVKLIKAKAEYDRIASVLARYYSRVPIEDEEMKEFGFEFKTAPNVVIQKHLDSVVSADPRMTKVSVRLAEAKILVDTCHDFIQALKDRHYSLKASAEHYRFQQGA